MMGAGTFRKQAHDALRNNQTRLSISNNSKISVQPHTISGYPDSFTAFSVSVFFSSFQLSLFPYVLVFFVLGLLSLS